MHLVEQAIFTSAVTHRAAGYHVVAQSAQMHEEDLRELAAWCPSHDSLLELGPDAVSYNFHPIPSGEYVISKTVPAGWEYSGRGGMRVYTHCLIVSPDILLKFSNNPFAILKAAQAGGFLEVRDPLPAHLEPISLVGGATAVDQTLLTELSNHLGARNLATLVQEARDSICLAVAGPVPVEKMLAGLFNCLPLSHRTEFSFSTGLKFSTRRPFRLIGLPTDPAEQRWLIHHPNLASLDFNTDHASSTTTLDGWSRFIEQVLGTGRTAYFSTQLSKRRFDLMPEDLPVLGLQLLEDLEATALRASPPINSGTSHDSTERSDRNVGEEVPRCTSSESNQRSEIISTPTEGSDRIYEDPRPNTQGKDSPDFDKLAAFKAALIQHAHAAHRDFAKSETNSEKASRKKSHPGPSKTLAPESPEVLEKLELLDDLVYDSIAGNASALNQLQVVWPALQSELNDSLLAESKEQYLRYALSIWEEYVSDSGVSEPARVVQALDVLCLLFEGE